MPRQPRRIAETGIYHVVTRGDGRRNIFLGDTDRIKFLSLLEERSEKEVDILAWCLMDNHVHLILEDPEFHLSAVLQGINTAYARYFNRTTGHVGHVFQGRFHSQPIESEAYFLCAMRYVHNNPQAAGISRADEYPWSSYRSYLGEGGFLNRERLLGSIGGRERFAAFSASAIPFEQEVALARGCSENGVEELCSLALGARRASDVASLPVEERAEALDRLVRAGVPLSRIEGLTGISRYRIRKELASSCERAS